ncbi:MAG: tetratricopeptide repeat protein [Candidatus Latescibacterota bacterium]|nr:MAG: tetratricopeptide repeat protein [Candidatus Latescibacterota bacterium]
MIKRTDRFLTVLLVLSTALCVAGTAVPSAHAQAGIRDITDDEIAITLDLLLQSRTYDAMTYLDSLESECAGEPLFMLTRARVFQNLVTAVDDRTDRAKELSQPALTTLEAVVDTCTKRVKSGDDDPKLLLYRGWARMQKAHLHALARAFYTAGREAGRGKKDLEKYLELHPDDPTANGLLGAYLYFTHAVPKVFKFLSKLLFLPTGDRERGLEMLDRALVGDGPHVIDYVLTVNFIHFFLEGRIEESLANTEELLVRYPHYPRSMMALAMAGPYVPSRYPEYNTLIKRMIAGVNAGSTKNIDWNSLYTVMVYRAYADRYLSNPRLAEARFRSIIHESPDHPDWVEGFARFELGQICAGDGRAGEARELFESIVDDKRHERFRDSAKKMLKDLEKYTGVTTTPVAWPDGLWIETVYRSGPDSLEALLPRFEDLAQVSLPAAFYTGECLMLLEDFANATGWYQRVVDWKSPAWLDTYRLIASTRIAEIHALNGNYELAAEYQKRALDFYHNEYRVDWIIEGRHGYFERLAKGMENLPAPTLFSPSGLGTNSMRGD